MKVSQQLFTAAALAAAGTASLSAALALDSGKTLSVYGDVGLRYELLDRSNPDAATQQRARYTFRPGLEYKPTEAWQFNVRARTGDQNGTNSAHNTFWHDNWSYGHRSFYLDTLFAQYKTGGLTLRAGQMDPVFYSQWDYWWDSEQNPLAAYGSYRFGESKGTNTVVQGAFFYLPDGAYEFACPGAGVQAVNTLKFEGGHTLTSAGGLVYIGEDGGASYAAGNDEYLLAVGDVQYGLKLFGQKFTVGGNLFYNLADSATSDNLGAVAGLSLGETKKQGDWRLRYSYAYVEQYATDPFLGQDTLAPSSFGGTNIKGHDVRFQYTLIDGLTIGPRYMYSERINGNDQVGHKFRIDLDYKF